MALTNSQQADLYLNGELLKRVVVGINNTCSPLVQGATPPTGINSSELSRVVGIAKGLVTNATKYAPLAVKELVRLTTLGQQAAEAQPGATPITYTQTQLNTPYFTETLIPDAVINGAMPGFFVVLINDPKFTAQ